MCGTDTLDQVFPAPRDLLNLLAEREALQLVDSETNDTALLRDWERDLTGTEAQVLAAYDRAVERWREHHTDEAYKRVN